ncbi:MAG TPA: hypothetical protein VFS00_01585 [Polyangiaceae bacterium]|nr:hypothetical protein [Polyangiaceae bacterium]
MMKPALLVVLGGFCLASLAGCNARGSSSQEKATSNPNGAANSPAKPADFHETETTDRTAPTATLARTPPGPTVRTTATGTGRPPPPPPTTTATTPPPPTTTAKTPPPPTTTATPPPPPTTTVKTPPPPPTTTAAPPPSTSAKSPGGRPPGPLKVPGKRLARPPASVRGCARALG